MTKQQREAIDIWRPVILTVLAGVITSLLVAAIFGAFSIPKSISKIEASLEGIKKELGGVDAETKANATKLDDLNGRVIRLEEHFSYEDRRLDKIEGTIQRR